MSESIPPSIVETGARWRRARELLAKQAPAPLPDSVAREFQRLAVAAFRAVDVAGLARVDFFLEGEARIWVNEINTLPGFTRFSAYPRLWEASGLPYPKLIDRLVELALERHAQKRGA